MDNTTLHTFLFHCPAALRSVILLGSWDNFSRPYPLELDARRGRSLWKGCFTFRDIICDGDLAQVSPKRDGHLKMGGTYWYYYKVDEDDECHNPSEPSTTVCPLLPGQRLNVLDIPREGHSRSLSDTSDAFTRNPKDRYLTPVPPQPLRPIPSPRIGASSPEFYAMPLPSPWAPKSATYPPADGFLSPNVVRHTRSASASPHMPSTPIFADFKSLKDKIASKRAASRSRSYSKTKELEIGSPVLISTTNEELNLIPLSVYQPPPTSAPRESPPPAIPISRPVPTIRKEFAPLASHPVDPDNDSIFNFSEPSESKAETVRRRRSHVPSTVISSEFRVPPGRIRANSADTRRTQHYLFSNDPWLSSPKFQQEFDVPDQLVEDDTPSAPILSRPASFLGLPPVDERPSSSHSSDHGSTLRQSPLNKELPALPRYLTPAPLFACQTPTPSVTEHFTEEPQEEFEEEEDDECLVDHMLAFQKQPRSHFSTWSSDSIAYSCPSSPDEETAHSPTLSSTTSTCSDIATPHRLSAQYTYTHTVVDDDEVDAHTPTILDSTPATTPSASSPDDEDNAQPPTVSLTTPAPQLDDLRISMFGPDLFNLDIQHADTAPRRQAACFGLGFYSLPPDESGSKSTITSASIEERGLGVKLQMQRGSGASQLGRLMDEFGFLGESVI
ncbi:hypothetical protein IQ07DRAFT_5958 [Pyrenochaeta sp. DS3sAY3a]|nr:hypothetical protein IQ07DRAFT_5958 [Pyrenochaeta sp. DS3sAY3a]